MARHIDWTVPVYHTRPLGWRMPSMPERISNFIDGTTFAYCDPCRGWVMMEDAADKLCARCHEPLPQEEARRDYNKKGISHETVERDHIATDVSAKRITPSA